MTDPLIVDPNEVNGAAAQWDALRQLFDKPAPDLTGTGPESEAARQAVLDAQAATAKLQSDIGQSAGTANAGATAYQTQEGQSASGMKPGDVTGVGSDLIGSGTSLFGVLPQIIGATTGLVGSGAGVLGSLTGAATSLARQGGGSQGQDHQQQGNSNNTNPEDSHDYAQPQQQHQADTDSAVSAAPAAALTHEQSPEGVRSA